VSGARGLGRAAAAIVALCIAPPALTDIRAGGERDGEDMEPAIDLLFIHHSCGGQLLADPGPDAQRAPCVYATHPNGGALRRSLAAAGYRVHEASYGSAVGEATDLFDWLPKFRSQMDRVLAVDENDRPLPPGRTNRIVVFKSCFPNSDFAEEGAPPGDPRGPALTLWNAKASLSTLLPVLAARPDVLFVYVTAPPRAPRPEPVPFWRALARRLRGRPSAEERLRIGSQLARRFNDWVKAPDGWLASRPPNVVVFDYFDVLTRHGQSNVLEYAGIDATDSHPAAAGNEAAAREFVPFLDGAVRNAGLAPQRLVRSTGTGRE
jgi:hypothetical protein